MACLILAGLLVALGIGVVVIISALKPGKKQEETPIVTIFDDHVSAHEPMSDDSSEGHADVG